MQRRVWEPHGVLVDYAGVLTGPVAASFEAFERSHGIDAGHVFELLVDASRTADGGLIGAIEVGRLSEEDFEHALRGLLADAGYWVPVTGSLLAAMFEALPPSGDLWEVLRQVRAHGHRTVLVSNSWGTSHYPRDLLAAHFDDVVISGEVGVRKPDPAIYRLANRRIDVPPHRCAFVDDLPRNVEVAVSLGMCGIVHDGDDAATAAALSRFLAVELVPASG